MNSPMLSSRCRTFQQACFYVLIFIILFNPLKSVVAYECPESDVSQYVKFYLYSSSIPDRIELFPNITDLMDPAGPALNASTQTKLITHGFQESPGYCNSTSFIIEAFKQFTDFNVILVDWSALSGRQTTDYPLVVACVRSTIAKHVGTFVNSLVEGGVAAQDVHLIGHSLGAQLIGIATEYIEFNVSRVTALDPAGPFFDHIASPAEKLDRDDAIVVDVLHTNSLLLGSEGPDGTVDFYMNGGTAQPKCGNQTQSDEPGKVALSSWHTLTSIIGSLLQNALSIALTTSGCDHHRSYQIFARSIDPQHQFLSYRCESVEDARSHSCHGDVGYAGYYLRDTEPGIYYTNTIGYSFKNLDQKISIILGESG